mmetsp:Transcript_34332/g.90937  ORF Transcript_34332/g.90937 Transcript_34332/m.90937 type:complete len:202 (-) Transcript_34332:1201-1806(-)
MPASRNPKNRRIRIPKNSGVSSGSTSLESSMSLPITVSSNSLVRMTFMPHLSVHRYCTHRRNLGTWESFTKKPANRICGTKRMGVSSCTVFTSEMAQPVSNATEDDATPMRKRETSWSMKSPLRAIIGWQMPMVTRDVRKIRGTSTMLLLTKYGMMPYIPPVYSRRNTGLSEGNVSSVGCAAPNIPLMPTIVTPPMCDCRL